MPIITIMQVDPTHSIQHIHFNRLEYHLMTPNKLQLKGIYFISLTAEMAGVKHINRDRYFCRTCMYEG